MCIFRYSELRKYHKKVLKKNAIVAYKAFDVHPDGTLVSPQRGKYWKTLIGRHDSIGGASIRIRHAHVGGVSIPIRKEIPGFHCLSSRSAALCWGPVVCRVKMWGDVYHYKGNGAWNPPGYLAQHIEIEAVISNRRSMYGDYLRKMFGRYPRLKDERKGKE